MRSFAGLPYEVIEGEPRARAWDIESGVLTNWTETSISTRMPSQLSYDLHTGFSKSWCEYTHSLVPHMYGNTLEVCNALRDALSPFQVLSKVWAATVLNYLPTSPTKVTIVGSWFGQLAVTLLEKSPSLAYQTPMSLIDKDATACYIAGDCLSRYPKMTVVCKDVFSTSPPSIPGSLVMWPGVEHFDPRLVEEYVRASASGTAWCFLGTDRPEPDHAKLYFSPNDLAQYFYSGNVKYKGSLRTPLGTRHMVVALT